MKHVGLSVLLAMAAFASGMTGCDQSGQTRQQQTDSSEKQGLEPLPFKTTPNGLQYHFHKKHDGPSPDSGDVVRLEILLETPDRDLINTFIKPEDYYEEVQPPAFKGDMAEILPKVSKGDSLTLRMPASQLYRGRVPPRIGYYDTVYTRVKVINFFNENKELIGYIARKNYQVDTLRKGLYRSRMASGTGNAIGEGDSVVLDLVGYLMDGQPFQRTTDDNPMTFTYGQKDLIKGLKLGLKGLRPGAHVRLFMTSDYGYGKKGARPYIIPFSSLIYDLKVRKVISQPA